MVPPVATAEDDVSAFAQEPRVIFSPSQGSFKILQSEEVWFGCSKC